VLHQAAHVEEQLLLGLRKGGAVGCVVRLNESVRIDFSIGAEQATFERSWVTGRSCIKIDDRTVPMASPFTFSTHFSFGRTRVDAVASKTTMSWSRQWGRLFFLGSSGGASGSRLMARKSPRGAGTKRA